MQLGAVGVDDPAATQLPCQSLLGILAGYEGRVQCSLTSCSSAACCLAHSIPEALQAALQCRALHDPPGCVCRLVCWGMQHQGSFPKAFMLCKGHTRWRGLWAVR